MMGSSLVESWIGLNREETDITQAFGETKDSLIGFFGRAMVFGDGGFRMHLRR